MSEKTPWEKYKESRIEKNADRPNKTARPWDLLNPATQYVDDSIANERFEICKSCPELIKITSQCKQCGCLMKVKTKIEHARCPLKKW